MATATSSIQQIENVRLKADGKLQFRDSDTGIYSDGSKTLVLTAADATSGKFTVNTGGGGFSVNSTRSGSDAILLHTSGESSTIHIKDDSNTGSAAINLEAASGGIKLSAATDIDISGNANSTIGVIGGDLALSTTTSGDISLSSAAAVSLSAAANSHITIGGTGGGSGELRLGASNRAVVVLGDLTVQGTTTTLESTITTFADNILVANALPGAAARDSGLMVHRHQTDVTTDTAAATGTTQTFGGANPNATTTTIVLASGASETNDAYNNWYIKITDDPSANLFGGTVAQISDYTGASRQATVSAAWTPAEVTGIHSATNNDPTISTNVDYTSKLHAGDLLAVDDGGGAANYVIDSVTINTIVLTTNFSGASGPVTIELLAPTGGSTYGLYNKSYVGLFYVEASDEFQMLATTSDPGAATVVSAGYRSLHVGGLTAESAVSIADSTSSTTTGSGALVVTGGVGIGEALNVGGVTKITSNTASTDTTSGALVVTGGVGIGGDLHVAGDFNVTGSVNYTNMGVSGSDAQIEIYQTNTSGTDAGLYMQQDSTTAPMIEFQGTSDTTSGLTKTLVNAVGNSNITAAQVVAYMLVKVTDTNNTDGVNTASGANTTDLYVPLYILNEE